jgi:hypothetical protein
LTFGSEAFRKRSKINASDENETSGEKEKKTLAKENLLSNNNNSHHTNNAEEPVYIVSRKWSSLYKSEDWWAVWIGLIIFGLSLPAYLGTYTLGWVPAAKPWLNITQALSTKATFFSPWLGLAASFVFLAILLVPVTRFNGIKSKDWFKGFVVIFSISWTIWILSNYSPIVKAIGSPEVEYIIALLVGIVIANLTRLPSWLKNSARGELFIKIAIVLLGAKILFTTFVTSAPSILAVAFLSFPVV